MSQLQKDNSVQDKNKSIPGARQCSASLSDLSHWGAPFRHVHFCRSENYLSVGGIRPHASGISRCIAVLHRRSRIGFASAQLSNTLQPPSAFAAISDPAARSRAIFVQAWIDTGAQFP
jgi:hypothetical protein